MKAIDLEIPANITAKQLIAALNANYETQIESKQYVLKTYYDSFDWRLFKQGLICEFNRSKQFSSLQLVNRKNGELVAATDLFDVPSFWQQFNPGKIRQALEPILEMRALCTLCTLECEAYTVDIYHKKNKSPLQLLIEYFALISPRIKLTTPKGNEKIAVQVIDFLAKNFGIRETSNPTLIQALKLQGRKPNDYSAKLDAFLSPEMPLETAAKAIFRNLLRTIRLNEHGVIADTDSEFLHDFRVAVRRTRTGINQMKMTMPTSELTKFKAFFSWLGRITNESRDLDVLWLDLATHQKQLKADTQHTFAPLKEFLITKKHKTHKQLADKLRSKKYRLGIKQWEEFVLENARPTDLHNSELTIKTLADKKIWKAYRQVIRDGNAIGEGSPPEALHELRKTCKKLRYLMEFFRSLYPAKRIDKLINRLKKLQDILGQYQNCMVQQERLQHFGQEIQRKNCNDHALLAIESLIKQLEKHQKKARRSFGSQFERFKKTKNKTNFYLLFKQSI